METIIFSTPIPNIFIDRFMPKASPAYSVVYIAGYRLMSAGAESFSLHKMGENLDILASEARKAWDYWQEQGLVAIKNNEYDNFQVVFLSPEKAEEKSGEAGGGEQEKPRPKAPVPIRELPHYSVEDVALSKTRDKEVERLFYIAQQLMGKLLTHTEMSMYLGFYDDLGLPVDVIEVMLDYCVSKNKKNGKYLTAVAFDWAEKNISSIEEAENYIELMENTYRQIMGAFGISGRNPSKSEIEYMESWAKELNTPLELIKAACDKTVIRIAKPSFPYADAIIKKWHEAGIGDMEGVSSLEEGFYENIKATKKKKAEAAKTGRPSKTRFNNFEGRDWDFDKLEQMEREHIDKILKKD